MSNVRKRAYMAEYECCVHRRSTSSFNRNSVTRRDYSEGGVKTTIVSIDDEEPTPTPIIRLLSIPDPESAPMDPVEENPVEVTAGEEDKTTRVSLIFSYFTES
jgi:hypothetical protein